MTRVDKLILGMSSIAVLGAFLSQCPAQAEDAFCARLAALPGAFAGSTGILLIAALAACSFSAMLFLTALHHRTYRRSAVGRIRSLAAELAWVAVPIVIMVGVAIPASGVLAS